MKIFKKLSLTSLLIIIGLQPIFSQNKIDSSDRVNKYFGVEIGPKLNLKTSPDTLAGSGFGIMLDYSWQVGGLNGKKCRTYISIPLGYSFMVDNKNHEKGSVLNYGWAITHELSKDSNNVPFIGYGILLNQYRFDGIKGSIFGHQSRFELGINHYLSSKFVIYGKLNYSYLRFPSLYDSKSKSMHQMEIKFGARILF
ncbi:MAG: hypothetical protein WCP69_09055 [Bacteroidota bacterium]